jgi:hypothetical protein
MNIFDTINILKKKEYFFIVLIFMISIVIIRIINPNTTLLLGIILACIISFIYIQKTLYTIDNTNNTIQNKYNALLIKPNIIILNYPDIIEFLYDIRIYYEYDLTNYNDIITELNGFFILYDSLIDNNFNNCSLIYDNLFGLKSKLNNYLANYIYAIPDDIYLMNNLETKKQEFDNILSKYLDNISNNCKINEFKKNKPLPYNLLQNF